VLRIAKSGLALSSSEKIWCFFWNLVPRRRARREEAAFFRGLRPGRQRRPVSRGYKAPEGTAGGLRPACMVREELRRGASRRPAAEKAGRHMRPGRRSSEFF